MNIREVAALAVRLIGIYSLVQALQYIQVVGTPLSEQHVATLERLFRILLGLVPVATLLACGAVLLVYGDAFAKRIARNGPDQQPPEPWTSQQVLAVAFSILGVYLIATSLPRLGMRIIHTADLYQMLSAQRPDAPLASMMIQQAVAILMDLLTVAVGVYLFVGGRNLSNLWHRLQSPGKATSGENV